MINLGHRSTIDPKRYAACCALARRALLAAGFDPLSQKLPEAIRRRAARLYRLH